MDKYISREEIHNLLMTLSVDNSKAVRLNTIGETKRVTLDDFLHH